MTGYDERCQYLLTRQKESEAEFERLKARGLDRCSRKWNEAEGEYAEIVDELESMEAGKWRVRGNGRY